MSPFGSSKYTVDVTGTCVYQAMGFESSHLLLDTKSASILYSCIYMKFPLPCTFCFCCLVHLRSNRLLLQWLSTSDMAAPTNGDLGLYWNTLLLYGGENAKFLCRSARILAELSSQFHY